MKRAIRTIVTVVTCTALGACSSIGTVNGVDISRGRMGVQTTAPAYCDTNPWICAVALAGTVGGILAIMAARGGTRSPAPPIGPPP